MMNRKKVKTPQELYFERKQRDEDEKEACLPPGLINHGNTCFMNSTLQGLIATRPLRDLIYFHPTPIHLQPNAGPSILSRRSPQLTNGHGLGGPDELEHVEGMPLGDTFTEVMRNAWSIQDAHRRETISPKVILTTIGRKYDQYLDFEQQDAHEFLRHLLDAMRMEELDIIKKRQPPPPKKKRGRPDPSSVPDVPPKDDPPPPFAPLSEDDKLESFVDMLFGGQFASILVCEKCKKISVTLEDFNDLSLSIKPEDYAKDRKRDRIKRIARKLRIRPPAATANPHAPMPATPRGRVLWTSMRRASSVPASPVRRSEELTRLEEEPPANDGPRRRSFDHAGEEKGDAREEVREHAKKSMEGPCGLPSAIEEDERENGEDEEDGVIVDNPNEVVIVEHPVDAPPEENESGRDKDKEKLKNGKEKSKDKDAWGKIARRISVSMKINRREKDADKDKSSRPSSRAGERGRKAISLQLSEKARSSRPGSVTPAASETDTGEASETTGTRPTSPTRSPLSAVPSPLATPPVPNTLSPPALRPVENMRRASTTPSNIPRVESRERPAPSKPTVLPKPSREESAYLSRILADVHPASNNPFSVLHRTLSSAGVAGPSSLSAQAVWAKLGAVPGVDECLRLFTAVEILDGENMVGCHRCWKIAHGTYRPRPPRKDKHLRPHSEESSESNDEDKDSDHEIDKPEQQVPPRQSEDSLSSSHSDLGRVSHTDPSLVSTNGTRPSFDSITSESSLPTTVDTHEQPLSPAPEPKGLVGSVQPSTYGGLPIPVISTTEPDTPLTITTNVPRGTPSGQPSRNLLSRAIGASLSAESLLTPKGYHRVRGRSAQREGRGDDSTTSDTSDDEEEYGFNSDTSATTSVYSDGSTAPSPSGSRSGSPQRRSPPDSPPVSLPSPGLSDGSAASPAENEKIPRSKQVIPRRMYKRYLIAKPPPILVIHLKRFHQPSKTYSTSFAGGFKKLDDFVAFPEFLDVAPFLAPKPEDFAGGKRASHKPQVPCMYRLYAVVVHIGSMLGGHYVAYTALPSSKPSTPAVPPAPTPPPKASVSSEPSSPDLETPTTARPPGLEGLGPAAYKEKEPAPSPTHQGRQWVYISDTTVRLTTLEEVLKTKAYICMYERI